MNYHHAAAAHIHAETPRSSPEPLCSSCDTPPKTQPTPRPWTPGAPSPRKEQPERRPPRHHLSQVAAATHTTAAATTRIWTGAPRSTASKVPAPGTPRAAARRGRGQDHRDASTSGGREQSPRTGDDRRRRCRRPRPATQASGAQEEDAPSPPTPRGLWPATRPAAARGGRPGRGAGERRR
nr:translation initiation factor IF-2-like [Aegilops tauschii subsp. strangulata]